MRTSSEGESGHVDAEDECDSCTREPVSVANISRSVNGGNHTSEEIGRDSGNASSKFQNMVYVVPDETLEYHVTKKQSTAATAKEAEGQEEAEMATVGSAALASSQLHAHTRIRVSTQPRCFGHSDDQTNIPQRITAVSMPEYYVMSSDDLRLNENGRVESDNSEVSAGEKRQSQVEFFDQRKKGQVPSLVSFFRLSSDSSSSASSPKASSNDCSPRSIADPHQANSLFSRTQNGQVGGKSVEGTRFASAAPAGMSGGTLPDEQMTKTFANRAGRRAPLARMLRAFSQACAETSLLLHALVHRAARPELENSTRPQQEQAVGRDTETECTALHLWRVFSRRETVLHESAIVEGMLVNPTPAGESEVLAASFPTSSPADSSEPFSSSVHGRNSAAEPVLDCVCFERKRVATPSQRTGSSTSHGVLKSVARAAGQVLASASALLARAAAAAAAAVEDDSDNGTDYDAGDISESDEDTAELEERFVFTSKTTPFQFVLWASKGSQLLLKSPLLRYPYVRSSVAGTLVADDADHDELSPRSQKLRQKKTQLYCFRAVALRLLLLICKETPEWYPDMPNVDDDSIGHTTVSTVAPRSRGSEVDVKGRRRRDLSDTISHCSDVTAGEAKCAMPEKGIFGYLVQKEADVLWQHWKRVARTERGSLQGEEALSCHDYGTALQDMHKCRRSACECETGTGEAQRQSGDAYIWHAAHRMLRVDSQLARLWAVKVPKIISEEEFWKQYFYHVYQVMKRCERQAKTKLLFSSGAHQHSKSLKWRTAAKLSKRRRSWRRTPRWRHCQRTVPASGVSPSTAAPSHATFVRTPKSDFSNASGNRSFRPIELLMEDAKKILCPRHTLQPHQSSPAASCADDAEKHLNGILSDTLHTVLRSST